jgi:3-isopropylmalate/(R)-2-methylmalate dehydratase large subunit
VKWWRQLASDADAGYDDRVTLDAAAIEPTVTWGINPGQSVGVGERIAANADEEALAFMGFERGQPIEGTRIDVAFIGSCTNGRLSDLEEAARLVNGRRVASHVKALVVPGSQSVRAAAEAKGLHEIFIKAGFEWRGAGCSMCLAMNPDRLEGQQEPRQARGAPDLRVLVESQFQGPPGQPDRPDPVDEPGDGGGGCGLR